LVSAIVVCNWECNWSSIFQPQYFCAGTF